MKFFGKTQKQTQDGYKSVFYLLGLPLVKKKKNQNTKKVYFCGIKIKEKCIPQITIINSSIDSTQLHLADCLNKALERNLREMKSFENETKHRLDEIEKKLQIKGK